MSIVNWNGNILPEDEVRISPGNLSFRYGDGCFETMKVLNGRLINSSFHASRLLSSLRTLQLDSDTLFSETNLSQQVEEIAQSNNLSSHARVRLTVYRDEDSPVAISKAGYLIQSYPGDPTTNDLNETGHTVDIYLDALKSYDAFSALKSNNYLPYLFAARWAKEKRLDDAIIMNSFNRIADGSKANIFAVFADTIKTPPLTEGCIAGTMRAYLLERFKEAGISFMEEPLTEPDLLLADELFLTNAICGIRWISHFSHKTYLNTTARLLHQEFILPLFR